MHRARTTCSRTPGSAEVSAATPAGKAGTAFHATLPAAGRPGASVVSALSVPVPEPARVVPAGAGVHRLVFVPGLATAAEVAAALAAVPPAAVCMGGWVGADAAEAEFVEFVEFDGPGPVAPGPWPGSYGAGPVAAGATGSGKAEVPAPAGHTGAVGAVAP